MHLRLSVGFFDMQSAVYIRGLWLNKFLCKISTYLRLSIVLLLYNVYISLRKLFLKFYKANESMTLQKTASEIMGRLVDFSPMWDNPIISLNMGS